MSSPTPERRGSPSSARRSSSISTLCPQSAWDATLATQILTVNTDLRDLSIIYVLAIVLYQVFARVPLDKMTAAAAALLICPAVGGLAPQYLFWPLVFILASGRVRAAIYYALSASSLYFVFFLIPGASAVKGESAAAYLPLRSLELPRRPSKRPRVVRELTGRIRYLESARQPHRSRRHVLLWSLPTGHAHDPPVRTRRGSLAATGAPRHSNVHPVHRRRW